MGGPKLPVVSWPEGTEQQAEQTQEKGMTVQLTRS
jgi:hypothetical protein